MNKQGKPYRQKAILNLDSSLRKLPVSTRRKDLNGVTRGELQRAVDDFRREGLTSSRIGSIINAVRSLYRWAEDRYLAAGKSIGPHPATSKRFQGTRFASPRPANSPSCSRS